MKVVVKKLYGPILWIGLHCEETVFFLTTQVPEIPGTHLIDLGSMKGLVDLGVSQWFLKPEH